MSGSPRPPIIDIHVHVAGIGSGSGCYVAPRLLRNWRYGVYLKAFGTSERELRERGDRIIFERIAAQLDASRLVDGAVLLALDRAYDPQTGRPDDARTEVCIPNEFVRDGAGRFGHLHFGASVNPYRRDWEAELERVAAEGAVLVKWLPAIQHIDPADARLEGFYRKLAQLDLPLLTHTGAERSFSRAEPALGDPQLLHRPLECGVTVIAAHLATSGGSGGRPYWRRLLPMLAEHPNLYTDISSLTQLNKCRYPRRFVDRPEIFPKLLYGTDFPLIDSALGPLRLVSPWYFPLPLARIRAIAREPNPWDRDLLLKRALGFPAEAFTRPARLLGLA